MAGKAKEKGGAGSGGTGGGSGGGSPIKEPDYRVSKIMLWPSRKINLGNYNTVDVSAGAEITFDKPVSFDSDEMKKACDEARKFIGSEFRKQLDAFGIKKKVDVKSTP